MTVFDSVQSALAAKAGHPLASTDATPEGQGGNEQAAPPDTAPSIEQDDHVGVLLQHLPISQDLKADLWDAVYNAKSPDDLAHSLKKFDISPHSAAALIVAKRLLDIEHPEPSRADKLKAAAQHMETIPKATLDLMESHPAVLKHLLSEPKS